MIGAEHPHLQRHPHRRRRSRPTPSRWPVSCSLAPTRTRPHGATTSGTPRACAPLRCAPRSAAAPSSTTEHDGMRLQIRTPGDLETMEFAAFDRVPPGPDEIEVAVSASSINFADVLVAFGRYPTLRRAAAATGYGLRRRGDRGRARRHRLTRSATMSAACPPTAAGPPSSPATRAWPSRCPTALTDAQAAAVTTASGHRLVRPAGSGPDQRPATRC